VRTETFLSRTYRRICPRIGPVGLLVLLSTIAANAQTATPTPTSGQSASERYEVTASTEIGGRWVDVNGSKDKFRSDLNYKSGFRVFDSSIRIEDKGSGFRPFDSALIMSSGWGSDPTGYLRVNLEKTGAYRLDSNVRRITFFNRLNTHALGQHDVDTKRTFGDIDLTVLPERPDFRFRIGYSMNANRGTAGYNTRAYADEFPVTSFVSNQAHDFRTGVDAKVFGFNLTGTYGYRQFNDDTRYTLLAPHLGNNPTNNARLSTFNRFNPVRGNTHHGIFTVQRTFAKTFDITARVLHTTSRSFFSLLETQTGRDNSNNQVDLDRFEISGDSKRPLTRGDIGFTYLIADRFRISNTFTFDRFNISGGNLYAQALFSRTPVGAPRPTVFTNTLSHRITSYRREMNTVEGDYQINNAVGFNIGYRFTRRAIALEGFTRNFAQPAPVIFTEDFDNTTHTLLAGMRIKPLKNWTINWNIEHGKADNVFTRLANYEFTNFRARSRMSFNKFALSLSTSIRNNQSPSRDAEDVPRDFVADTRSRIVSGSFDWYPVDQFHLSTGYTYQYLNSETAIIVPVAGQRRQGLSQFFIRDHYGFVDVSIRPVRRVTIFGSYRFNDDRGQKDLVSTVPENIITSYPMQFYMPEIRMAIKLSRNIDWNLGYQYFDYNDNFLPVQNYNAHLPYTSLRIYFGKRAGDR
jgi:hypothetical protein